LDSMQNSSNVISEICDDTEMTDLEEAKKFIVVQHNMISTLVTNFKLTASELQKTLNNFYKMKHRKDVATQIIEERISEN